MEIKNAAQVWAEQENKQEFEAACERVMCSIERASKEGCRDACFNPSVMSDGLYNAVKAEFVKHGYHFCPTGIVGGVRQTTEQICW